MTQSDFAVVSLCSCFKSDLFFESKVDQVLLRDELGSQNDVANLKNFNFSFAESALHDVLRSPEGNEFSIVVILSTLGYGNARGC